MICPTRWTVRTKALDAIIKNYKLLIPALLEIHNTGRDEYALKAGGFLQLLDKYSTYVGLKLAHCIFSAMHRTAVKFTSVQGHNYTRGSGWSNISYQLFGETKIRYGIQ